MKKSDFNPAFTRAHYSRSEKINAQRIDHACRISKILFAILILFWSSVLLRCTGSPASLAGGASSTEVSFCTVKGSVVDSLDRAVSGSIVRLRPFNYTMEKNNDSNKTAPDVSTDEFGRYSFDGVLAGRYCVECVFQDSFGLVIDCTVDSGETMAVLSSAMLRPMAVIMGSNMPSPPEGSKPPQVFAFGMDHAAPIDKTGSFVLRVPPGWTRLSLPGMDSTEAPSDTLIYLQPGERVFLGSPQPKPPKHCDSLACELSIIREVLDSSGLAAVVPESVVVISQNHIVELHLRSLGIKRLSPSINKLDRLRVLDVGKNSLDSIPAVFDHFHDLNTLIADSNSLWIIPASIGMMKSLQKLDLSNNKLQTLPEPITYLRPSMLLNLENNMLCNIGEQTAKWADQYDPHWRQTQQCH
jgi:hypothetical protein